jgi:RimJ/RimL family protein N-acetyltransferase
VNEFIIDPEPKNTKAIAAYEKVGFQKKDLIETPNGIAQLMTLNPKDFIKSQNK